MTDKMTTMRTLRDRKVRWSQVVGVFTTAFTIVLISSLARAQESTDVIHFIDTNTDRTPALTAFPRYPSVARRDRIEGEATVCFKIRADGRISRPVVTERTHKIFAKPALRAIKKSTFEPLGPGQILATARTCRIYRFRLDPVVSQADPKDRG
jgi:TonB family protein